MSRLPEQKHEEVFRAGLLRSVGRLFFWLYAALLFFGGNFLDKVRRKDTIERRAGRLRRTLERIGTTFIKFGQQFSIRIDLIPYEYARELEKMLDEIKIYPAIEDVVEVIERTTGKPLDEVFLKFDPEPIGSASIACVYQAQLRENRKKVAVKVRRPGIGRVFAADMRALGWLLRLAELYFISPGFSRPFLYELRTMLFEELDFEKEARFTDLFRRRIRKTNIRYVTAPRVYFEYSGKEVLVEEFVSGFWLKEIIHAIETKDSQALAVVARHKIKPKKLARRILTVARYGFFEGIFFHGDLHPANILVRPGSKITLIDFGSCGSMTEKEQHAWRHLLHAQAHEDVGGMAQAALRVFSAIPPIDVDEFLKKMEAIFWDDLYANKSKDAAWWERTSVNMWIRVLQLSREYNVPVNLNLLRILRLSLLSDTLAARLYPKIDHWREYSRFAAESGRRAKRRIKKRLKWFKSDEAYIRYEELLNSGFSAFFRMQNFLDSSIFTLAKLEHAVAFGSGLLLRLIVKVAAITVFLISLISMRKILRGEVEGNPLIFLKDQLLFDGWYPLFSNEWYFLFLVSLVLVNVRRMLGRLDRKDFKQQQG
ncbi:MAG: AarF/ABC1/UbiB kinase family protein [bacterium]|nr:AarF/ABC1/UbiB kinase family protein [bacterium]